MRPNRLHLFASTPPKPLRRYVRQQFQALRPRYPRLVIPAVGAFHLVAVALDAGYQPEDIETRDTTLLSTVVGCLASGQSLAPLGVQFSGYLAFLEPYRETAKFAGAICFAARWAQLSRPTYFEQAFRREIEADPPALVEAYTAVIDTLVRAVEGIRFQQQDCLAAVSACRDRADTLLWLQPPANSKHERLAAQMGEGLAWQPQAQVPWRPKPGYPALFALTQGAQCLTLTYRHGPPTVAEEAHSVLCLEARASRVDRVLCNRPDEVSRQAVRRRETKIRPAPQPLLPPSVLLTPTSQLTFVKTTREVALYYRDLFAHKLGATRSEQYYLGLCDGYIWAACGFHTGDALRRRVIDGVTCVHETFGFCMPSRHMRIVKLMLLCLTAQDFYRTLVADTPALGFVGPLHFQTACLADVPELKTHRGVSKLIDRKPLPNGKWHLTYRTPFAERTYAECLARWLAKDGQVAQEVV